MTVSHKPDYRPHHRPLEADHQHYVHHPNKYEVVWKNVIAFIFLHSSLLYGAYRLFTDPPWKTMAFAFIVGTKSGLGITAGAHRLWSHRAYKAKLPLRIFLAFLQTTAGQVSLPSFSQVAFER